MFKQQVMVAGRGNAPRSTQLMRLVGSLDLPAETVVGGSHEAGWGPQLNTLKEKPHGANPFPPTRLETTVDQLISAYAGVRHASQSPCVLVVGGSHKAVYRSPISRN